ncbi:hypothetical protein QU481_23425 [Crenobacter sp. SG2303]|uniref:Uncharacterized protein n=1 Tax=Crenobacter oryzisoli TaxID=3056844 RepID=A0ABT7XVE3_9NEIS|nr:hypothetical protein [Crenobacter sp. SG2303]MDN0077756.1 hypothetical protein [Crenobacter sp. SG2303]
MPSNLIDILQWAIVLVALCCLVLLLLNLRALPIRGDKIALSKPHQAPQKQTGSTASDMLYKQLLHACLGDKVKAEWRIAYEFKLRPSATRTQAISHALDRLHYTRTKGAATVKEGTAIHQMELKSEG